MSALGSYSTGERHTDGWFRLDRQIRAAHAKAALALGSGNRKLAASLIAQANRMIAERNQLV